VCPEFKTIKKFKHSKTLSKINARRAIELADLGGAGRTGGKSAA
jgi:hypothetical protein